MRRITAEADVNLAAVNYHFGSKEALLAAVFERRLGPLNRERLEGLARLEKDGAGRPPDLEAVIRAFVGPALRMRYRLGEAGNRFMQLVGRSHSEPDARVHALFFGMFREVIDRFLPALEHALPHLARDEIVLRFHFVVGAMAHSLLWARRPQGIYGDRVDAVEFDAEGLLEALVRFAVAGLGAPAAAGRGGTP